MSVCVCMCVSRAHLQYGGVGEGCVCVFVYAQASIMVGWHCPKAHMWNMYAYVVRELLVGVTSYGSRG